MTTTTVNNSEGYMISVEHQVNNREHKTSEGISFKVVVLKEDKAGAKVALRRLIHELEQTLSRIDVDII